jgi:chromosome segregation ATPase
LAWCQAEFLGCWVHALISQELSQVKMQMQNMESTLQATHDKLKSEEKENQRLQYGMIFTSHTGRTDLQALDSGSSSGGSSGAAAKRMQDQKDTLEAEIRELKNALKRSEGEKETLRAESSSGGGGFGFSEVSCKVF